MKNPLILLLLSLISFGAFAQKKDYFSAEANTSCILTYFGNNESIGYGGSFILSKYFNKFKISSGISLSTIFFKDKSYAYNVESEEYKINFLYYPVYGNFEIFTKKSFSFSISFGFNFCSITYDEIKYNYLNGEVTIIKGNYDHSDLRIDCFQGPCFSKSFGRNFKLNLSPTFHFKFGEEYYDPRSSPNVLSDKLSINLTLGLEYLLTWKKAENAD